MILDVAENWTAVWVLWSNVVLLASLAAVIVFAVLTKLTEETETPFTIFVSALLVAMAGFFLGLVSLIVFGLIGLGVERHLKVEALENIGYRNVQLLGDREFTAQGEDGEYVAGAVVYVTDEYRLILTEGK